MQHNNFEEYADLELVDATENSRKEHGESLEKHRERKERLAKSGKARDKRKLIKGKQARRHDAGFRGNV